MRLAPPLTLESHRPPQSEQSPSGEGLPIWRKIMADDEGGYPDLTIFSPEYLERGIEAIRLVGYFGHDWSFGGGEWARP
jgi:hypothetical protein